MKDYHQILGVPRDADLADIKHAYRQAAAKWHPDRLVGASPEERAAGEARFKEAKEAYEALSSGQWSSPRPRETPRPPRPVITEVIVEVTLREAFEGFSLEINSGRGEKVEVKVPAGSPSGHRHLLDLPSGEAVGVTVALRDSRFALLPPRPSGWHRATVDGDTVDVVESGHVEVLVEVDALDLLIGGWAQVSGIQGEHLQVRVPAGLQMDQRLKVKGQGYYHWCPALGAPLGRGDLLVKVLPRFGTPRTLDPAKVEALYQQVQVWAQAKDDER